MRRPSTGWRVDWSVRHSKAAFHRCAGHQDPGDPVVLYRTQRLCSTALTGCRVVQEIRTRLHPHEVGAHDDASDRAGRCSLFLVSVSGQHDIGTSGSFAIVSFSICYLLIDSGVDVGSLLAKVRASDRRAHPGRIDRRLAGLFPRQMSRHGHRLHGGARRDCCNRLRRPQGGVRPSRHVVAASSRHRLPACVFCLGRIADSVPTDRGLDARRRRGRVTLPCPPCAYESSRPGLHFPSGSVGNQRRRTQNDTSKATHECGEEHTKPPSSPRKSPRASWSTSNHVKRIHDRCIMHPRSCRSKQPHATKAAACTYHAGGTPRRRPCIGRARGV